MGTQRPLADVPWFIAAQIWAYDPETGAISYTKKWATRPNGEPRKINTEPNQYGYIMLAVPKSAREDVGATMVSAHRIAFLLHHRWVPPQVDHEDRDRSNNRIGNLRPASDADNNHNRGLGRDNTSGYKGVHKLRGKWVARIRDGQEHVYLGAFNTPEEAAYAYDDAALGCYGKFAATNVSLGLIKPRGLVKIVHRETPVTAANDTREEACKSAA